MDSLQENNIDDILEKKEWEVRNEANWLDEEGEKFLRNYHVLSKLPKMRLQLRERESTLHSSLRRPPIPPQAM